MPQACLIDLRRLAEVSALGSALSLIPLRADDSAFKSILLLISHPIPRTEMLYVDILEHTILKEIRDERNHQQFSDTPDDKNRQRQQHEDKIQREYKNFLHQIERKLWHPRDLTKRQMIKNAVSGRLTARLWCSLVLTGTHNFGR
jgi:hypothetical protein